MRFGVDQAGMPVPAKSRSVLQTPASRQQASAGTGASLSEPLRLGTRVAQDGRAVGEERRQRGHWNDRHLGDQGVGDGQELGALQAERDAAPRLVDDAVGGHERGGPAAASSTPELRPRCGRPDLIGIGTGKAPMASLQIFCRSRMLKRNITLAYRIQAMRMNPPSGRAPCPIA